MATIRGSNPADLRDKFHAFLKQYSAQLQRDVSSAEGQIYYSRPTRKWFLARKNGLAITITAHQDCPCGDL